MCGRFCSSNSSIILLVHAGQSDYHVKPYFDDFLPFIAGCLQVPSPEPDFRELNYKQWQMLCRVQGWVWNHSGVIVIGFSVIFSVLSNRSNCAS
mmetsp:Transcript_4254/g.7458  ORF Transcript_4254/g.7458 Transcript_4254/m.7458 type:complete len:94 (-) Transcript_4254:914-1195(-)